MSTTKELEKFFRIASQGNSCVLITGATGTGKTRLAKKIHDLSGRRTRPFITVNLASLHEGTLESELFGHERGAFTGAEQRRVGRLEQAQGGTVFLDEIGELSPGLQARLLEFLQSKTIRPVGSNRENRLDVRVIAATHRDLEEEVARGSFREDLFHRIRVLSVHLKSLNGRPEDFDEILHHCLEEVCKETGKMVLRISEGAAEAIERYDWPGNIRELRNVLEYAVQSCEGTEIQLSDLPPWFGKSVKRAAIDDFPSLAAAAAKSMGYQAAIDKFERAYILSALESNEGRINRTARAIGMNKTTFIRRMRAHGL